MRPLAPFLLAAILFASPRAPAQTNSSDEKDLKLAAQADIEKEAHTLPYLGRHPLSDVVSFVMHDGKLYPTTQLPVGDPGYVRLSATDRWAKVTVLGRKILPNAPAERYLQFVYRDISVPQTVEVVTEVYSSPTVVNVSREAELPEDGMSSIQFLQSATAGENAVTLYLQTVLPAGQTSPPARRLTAASLAELTQKQPRIVDEYLRPIFRSLAAEQIVFDVDPKAAYQIFQPLCTIDPATTAAVASAVTGLGADSYDDREAAMTKLLALGQPAALCLMRTPPRHLTPEQSMRVELFLSPYRPLTSEQTQKSLTDVDFLLDCQFSGDATIRRLAREQYEKVTGRGMAVDENLSGPALADALIRLRPSPVSLPSPHP